MKNWQGRVREVLRKAPDGLTIKDMMRLLLVADRSLVRDTLRRMPDAYIDRWTKEGGTRGRYAAVWCVVIPPENCPPPDKS